MSDSTLTWEDVRAIALALPGVEEGTAYGTSAFRVQKNFLARWNDKEDALVIKVSDLIEQDILIQSEPETYFITPHYVGYPAVLVRLSKISRDDLVDLFDRAWQHTAPKKLRAESRRHAASTRTDNDPAL